MNFRFILFLALGTLSLFACKKDTISTTISHTVINRKLHAAHTTPMNLDVNGDGTIDFSYFMQYVVLSGNVNLYIGVNPVFGGETSASEQNDNEFLNMGNVHDFAVKTQIKESLTWTDEHALLGTRREAPNATRTYFGHWGNGQEKIMALRFQVQGKTHYGWARLKFDKATEELLLIDAAWNTIADQEISAGAK